MFTKINALVTGLILAVCLPSAGQTYKQSCGNGGNNDADCKSTQGSNPVNVLRAGLLRSVTDLKVFGAAPFEFRRIYNSRRRTYTTSRWEMGTINTWQHNWQYELRESSLSDFGFPRLILRYPEGREKIFRAIDSTGYVRVPDAAWGDRLYPTVTPGNFVLLTPEGRQLKFNRVITDSDYQYLLNEVNNGLGFKWTLTYQIGSNGNRRLHRITNNFGRYIEITRSEVGNTSYWKIDQVATDDGRVVTYTYSNWSPTNEHVLTAVNYPDTTNAIYTWCGGDSLTSGPPVLSTAIDPNYIGAGARTRYLYNYNAIYSDSHGELVRGTILEEQNYDTGEVSVRLPNGGGEYPEVLVNGVDPVHTQFAFSDPVIDQISDNVIDHIDQEGRHTAYTYQTVNGVANAGFLISQTDDSGAVTTYLRDAVGHVISKTNALAHTESATYNAANFVTQKTDESGRITTYQRGNGLNNCVTQVVHPDGGWDTFAYDSNGLLLQSGVEQGSTYGQTYYTYDNTGGLVSVSSDPDFGTRSYHSNGLLASKSGVTFTYDWKGQLLRTTNADGTYRENTYGIHGRLLSERDELGNVTTHQYDSKNRRTSTTAPLGRVTSWTYGAASGCCGGGGSSPLTETAPSGRSVSYTYDRNGRTLSETVATGTSAQSTRAWTYDGVGNVITETDPLGRVITHSYDLLKRRISTTTPFGATTYQYGILDQPTVVTSPTGAVTTNAYDTLGRLASVTQSGPGLPSQIRTFAYSQFFPKAFNSHVTETSPDGRVTRRVYDEKMRVTSTTLGHGTTVAATSGIEYGYMGRVLKETGPLYTSATHTYNNRGFRTQSKDQMNRTTVFTHDLVGRIIKTTSEDINVLTNQKLFTQNVYNSAGEVTQTIDELGHATAYTYDNDGRILSLTTPKGHTRSWSYDSAGRLYRKTYPNGTYEQFTYHLDGQVATYRTPAGSICTFSYNPAGKLISRNWSDSITPDVTYAYDTYGRMTSCTNGATTTLWTYDILGRKTSETQQLTGQPNWTLAYTYDGDGNLASVTYPDGHVVSYGYTPRNQIASVTAGGSPPLATYSYNLLGQITQVARENNFVTNTTYTEVPNARNTPNTPGKWYRYINTTQQLGTSPGEPKIHAYDVMDRWVDTSTLMSPAIDRPAYDEKGQLIEYWGSPSLMEDSGYDESGNRIWHRINNTANGTPYLTNNMDQYTKIGTVNTTHDTDGNLLTATPAHGSKAMTMTWDSENRLLTSRRSVAAASGPVMPLPSLLNAGARITNTYDVQHRRVQKVVHRLSSGSWVLYSTTRYTYDGWNVVHETTTQGSNVTNTRYTWGQDQSGSLQGAGGVGGLLMAEEISSNGTITPHYYVMDQNGNVSMITTATGATEASWSYTPFGVSQTHTSPTPTAFANRNPWRYNCKYVDHEVETKSGIYYYGYRHYSPQMGRWLSRDPLGEQGGVNLYGMVGNDPANKWDYLGLAETTRVSVNVYPMKAVWDRSLRQTVMRPSQVSDDYGTVEVEIDIEDCATGGDVRIRGQEITKKLRLAGQTLVEGLDLVTTIFKYLPVGGRVEFNQDPIVNLVSTRYEECGIDCRQKVIEFDAAIIVTMSGNLFFGEYTLWSGKSVLEARSKETKTVAGPCCKNGEN